MIARLGFQMLFDLFWMVCDKNVWFVVGVPKSKVMARHKTDQHATHLIGKRIARNVGLEPIRIWFQLPRNVVNSRNHAQVITICYGCEFQ